MVNSDVKSVFDTQLDEAEEAWLDAVAEAEIEAGDGVPHEKVRLWLGRLAEGERIPPPKA